jgi:dTDP-glucose 4,6-dehydratase
MPRNALLITGGAGFIGANYIPYFLEQRQDRMVVNLDKITYAGDLKNLAEISAHENYMFVEGDICNRVLIEELFTKYDFKAVIHFAAESHVDNSIKNPDAFIQTNIFGTFNVLDVAKKFWMDGPNQFKEGCEQCRFHHISTDEVYGTLGETGLFTEDTSYAPNSPYSASKASSDFIVRSYFIHTE